MDPKQFDNTDKQAALAERLREVLAQKGLSGLGGIELRSAGGGITIWWKGQVPSVVQRLVAEWPVAVSFAETLATEEESTEAVAAVARASASFPFDVREVGLSPDRNSIELRVPATQIEDARAFVNSDPASVFASLPIPVTVQPAGPQAFPAGRGNDVPPFWGGAYIDIDGDGDSQPDCSVGFSVVKPSGTDGLLSARHCGPNTPYSTLNDRRVGTSGGGDKGTDSMMISGQSYGPRIFNGQDPYPVNQTSGSSSLPVVGARNPEDGERVCFSGAFSGEECANAYVAEINKYVDVFSVGLVGPGFWVYSDDSGRVHGFAGPGDSGGPVYEKTKEPDGTYVARARGLITSYRPLGMMCPGYEEGDDRRCSTQIFNINIGAVQKELGVSVMTQ